jgi:hypothetical protein
MNYLIFWYRGGIINGLWAWGWHRPETVKGIRMIPITPLFLLLTLLGVPKIYLDKVK